MRFLDLASGAPARRGGEALAEVDGAPPAPVERREDAGPAGGDIDAGSRSAGAVAGAIAAARRAQGAWAARPVAQRLEAVAALRAALARDGDQLAALSGRLDRPGWRVRAEALAAEVVPLADACAFLLRRAESILAPVRPATDERPAWLAGVDLEVHREPHGVVLVVAPSNYPILLPGVQALQALVAGNAVVVKPGPGGSPAARWLADRLAEGGLPPELLAILPEAVSAVHQAVAAGVDKVVFTGSAGTGAALLAELAPRLVPATLELSGCDPLIALEGADAERVVRALAFGLRLHGGATCIAPRRAYLHRSLFEAVERGIAAAAADLLAGGDPAVGTASRGGDLRGDAAKARQLAAAAVAVGARWVHGGADPAAPDPANEGPWVVAAPPAASWPGDGEPGLGRCAGRRGAPWGPPDDPLRALERCDLFAPLLTLVPVADAAEAVARANASPYALGASVFGDEEAARAVAARLDAGVVTLNDVVVPTADPRLPFGGRRRSGFGVTRGAEGLLEMTAIKAVAIRRPSRRAGGDRHLDPPLPADESLFRAYLALAHGDGLAVRLGAVPALLRGLWGRLREERKWSRRGRETHPTSRRTAPRRRADRRKETP